MRSPSPCLLAVALALAACSPPSTAAQPPPLDGAGSGHDDGPVSADARTGPLPDAHGGGDPGAPHDAAADSSPMPIDASGGPDTDAGSPGGGGGGGGTPGGVVACYTTGTPDAVCTLPVHCCFTNYSSAHEGACSSGACTWGTIDCDGPEDCPSGQRCCAHVIEDPTSGITGYTLACQTAACGAAPGNQELCHPTASPAGTCSSPSASCVPALNNDNDLPRSLDICQ